MIEYKITDISHHEDAIKRLFLKQPFGRYLSDRKIEKRGAIAYEWNRLREYSKKLTLILAIKDAPNRIKKLFKALDYDNN